MTCSIALDAARQPRNGNPQQNPLRPLRSESSFSGYGSGQLGLISIIRFNRFSAANINATLFNTNRTMFKSRDARKAHYARKHHASVHSRIIFPNL